MECTSGFFSIDNVCDWMVFLIDKDEKPFNHFKIIVLPNEIDR